MSAFYDIWIGDSKPVKARLNNSAWQKDEVLPFYLSLPGNSTFIHQTQSSAYRLVRIGQYYELVNEDDLLNNCVEFVKGESSFHDPAGHYLLFLFDISSKYVHVFTNRLGTYHAYWRSEKGNTAISTYYLELAATTKNKQLDWQGITGFLGMGFFPLNKTYLEQLEILEPASHYCFDENLNLLSRQRYWNWTHNPKYSPKEHIGQLDDILKSSLSIGLKNKRVALPISGGLDSRVLAGVISNSAISTIPRSVAGFSYGYGATSVETAIANKIAQGRDIKFEHFEVPNYLFDKMKLISDSVELFQYVDGTRQAGIKDWLEEQSDVVVGGHWGDVWMDDMGIESAANDGLLKAFRKKIIKNGSAWLMKEVCEPYYKNCYQYLDDYFTNYIDNYRHIEDPDFRMKIFKTDQWSFRWTLSSIRMYQAASFPVLPFYDRRITELFITVPTKEVAGRELEIEYLKVFHPDLARIKWQEYSSNLYNYKIFNNRNLVYRVVNKVKRTLSTQTPVRRNWEIFYLNSKGRTALEEELLNSKFSQIVSVNKVHQLLDEFYKNPSGGNGYTVSMLLTFAQFIKQVF